MKKAKRQRMKMMELDSFSVDEQARVTFNNVGLFAQW
jgi:hypothetical protein